jgi:hypothetical protein
MMHKAKNTPRIAGHASDGMLTLALPWASPVRGGVALPVTTMESLWLLQVAELYSYQVESTPESNHPAYAFVQNQFWHLLAAVQT